MYLKSQKDISHSLHNGMVDVFHCIMMPEFIRHGPAVFAVCFFPQLSEYIDYPLSGITAAHCILKKLCFPRINFPYFPVVLFQQFCHATVEGHIMLGVSFCFMNVKNPMYQVDFASFQFPGFCCPYAAAV